MVTVFVFFLHHSINIILSNRLPRINITQIVFCVQRQKLSGQNTEFLKIGSRSCFKIT